MDELEFEDAKESVVSLWTDIADPLVDDQYDESDDVSNHTETSNSFSSEKNVNKKIVTS